MAPRVDHSLADAPALPDFLKPGLLDGVLECLTPQELARAAASAALLHRAAAGEDGVAERQLRRLTSRTVVLSRWRRPSGARPRLPAQELHLAQSAVRHLQRIAGVYRLGSEGEEEVTLEVAPDGHFVNHSANHRFVGQATIAAVVPAAEPEGYAEGHLYLLDRWYTECWAGGRRLAATELPFVDQDFRCFSAHGFKPGRPGALGRLFENRPQPHEEQGWDASCRPGQVGTFVRPWPLALGLGDLLLESDARSPRSSRSSEDESAPGEGRTSSSSE